MCGSISLKLKEICTKLVYILFSVGLKLYALTVSRHNNRQVINPLQPFLLKHRNQRIYYLVTLALLFCRRKIRIIKNQRVTLPVYNKRIAVSVEYFTACTLNAYGFYHYGVACGGIFLAVNYLNFKKYTRKNTKYKAENDNC